MGSYKVEGIIIKRKNFGETDRILTVFTKKEGKIKILAKGVRKINSRRAPHVELLNLSILNLHEGKMLILTEAETRSHYSSLKNDLKKAGFAFYVCELVDGLVPEHQENRAVYNLLEQTLYDLEIIRDPRPLIKRFEQEILILLGFWSRERMFLEEGDRFIEDLMEKKIKTKRIFPDLS
ncbi:MAG: DNA repair protein RecO [Candidatus Levybacteria bacterium]|nr:DNA repair protein RecO [Candidatus Levybacteria bacterium]